jgi:hypothetical protein
MSKLSKKSSAFKNLLGSLVLCFVILGSGCAPLAPSETPTPTATQTQTLTPSPTIDWFPATQTPTLAPLPSQTPLPTIESQREGIAALLIDDDFSDDSLWQTSQSAAGNVAYGTEALTLAVAAQNASLSSLSQHVLPENFYLEFSMQISLCQPEDQIGVLFWHLNDGDYYRLLLTCSGQYRLELIQGGQSVVIHNWETASQMNLSMPATNRIGLWAGEGRFQFYIDDVFQFEERIAENRTGALGFFARTIEGSAMTIRFSDLQIYRVELQE